MTSLIHKQPINPERNWLEDYHLENGEYYCRCRACNHFFIGYKRRVRCKLCADNHVVLDKEYTGESILDLESHIQDLLDNLPKDDHGFVDGTLHITIRHLVE